MKRLSLLCLLLSMTSWSCGDDGPGGSADHPNVGCDDVEAANCTLIASGDSAGLIDAVNLLTDDTAIILGTGTYTFDNQVTIRNADDVTLIGQGMGTTTLDFGAVTTQVNGVDAVGDRFHIEGLTILDARKDALRVEDSDVVTIRAVETTWSGGALSTNGAYGIYPVKCSNVLLEDSVASFASDAGIYVGQSENVIVRNNTAHDNVAGIEIENTQFADVYGNTAENNTGGLVVFDLPGNPIVGRDVWIHDNVVRTNNHANFAPGGTVAQIPPGTGTFAMASRRVVLEDNTYDGNATVDIAIVSGLVIAGNPADWAQPASSLVGQWDDLALVQMEDQVFNFRSENIVVRNNTHTGGGTNANLGEFEPEFGALFLTVYGSETVDNVVYDAIGESMFSADDPSMNSNDNRICMGGSSATFASLDLEHLEPRVSMLELGLIDALYRPDAPYAPFDCDALEGGALVAVTLPQLP